MNKQVEVKSNWILLTIVSPKPDWQAQELAEILQVLNRGPAVSPNLADETRRVALTQLRYLGTEEAARELARRLRGDDNQTDFQCMFGLVGSPHRDFGLEEMNRLLENPGFPVTQMFLNTMSILPLDAADEPEILQAKKEMNWKALNDRFMDVLAHKRGKALAISLDTALGTLDSKMSKDSQKELVPELVGAFGLLSADQQASWLQYRWDVIKDPKWIPLLRTLALQYKQYPEPHAMDAYQSLQVTGAALKRWYEMDPDGARDAVIREITRPTPRYDANVVGLLPDQTLPEVGHQLAQHFLTADDYEIEGNIASLLFRYADSNAWPEVSGKVAEKVGTWACVPQNTMLAYALRVDPQSAATLIERAIAARGAESNACRHMLFTDIGALHADPVLDDLAIRSLADMDPQVASNAADYLRIYADSKAEQPLRDRYERWSKQWSGREKDLRFVYAAENPNVYQEGLGESLAGALATGAGWLADDDELRRIEELAVGPNMLQRVEEARKAWLQRPFMIRCMATGLPSAPRNFDVAQYNLRSIEALETKLNQFPSGTKFLWDSSNCDSSAETENVFDEFFRFATENGIQLQRAPVASTGVE
jgi:hypothetical protein